MNRPIYFRVWDGRYIISYNNLKYDFYIDITKIVVSKRNDGVKRNPDHVVSYNNFMFRSPYKDSNGVFIYDKDIILVDRVKLEVAYSDYDGFSLIHEVNGKEDTRELSLKEFDTAMYFFNFKVVVIGNKYEGIKK